ncbi:MAG: OstA-like protein [Bacteroidales bacterium]
MAEIESFDLSNVSLTIRYTLFATTLFLSFSVLDSQEVPLQKPGKTMIEVLHADEGYDEVEKLTGKRMSRLIGNVELKHKDILMWCDSARFYTGYNQIKAYSRIHMQQGDTLELTGDSLFYDGTTETSTVDGHVELIDKETHLYTNSAKYDVAKEVATYDDRGKIINGENTLTSIIGIYYVTENMFHFKDSVKIVNPEYVMTGDTMDYNTKTETAFFTGPSEMVGDSLYLYCEKGWYDTKNDISRIWKNAMIDNRQQVIRGDSLFYNGQTGYGESFRNTSITDTTNDVIVRGNYAWYYKTPERFMVTDSAVFIQVSDNRDSLYMHADTISSVTRSDSTSGPYRLMRAFYGCRIFSKDLQAKCDSLSYSFRDSVIRLFDAPVIWSQENQLTADTIAIYTKNRQADHMRLYNNAFIAAQVDQGRYNQIKGRSMTGYFRNNELYKIEIEGNGETVYYLLDGDKIVGVNKAKCARVEILVDHGKIMEINEYQNPEGVIDPPGKVNPEATLLEGFSWLDLLRPKKVSDIFVKY